ncbi:long-chain fatty acid--CoA ligase [Mycobacterium heckeshornense]|uniref:AMP-binding protein n=1 Tax=Mycobacterium heckeshornense TaxID=110505 RepID=A0A2G8BH17_9MYCO|nr:class I adenylate-forming enzyme family protein [Mycobacterium heckeshornense]KMV21031.1 AMP-binding protein [Mycobacterium heckeshornense]MCV7032724.1 acyl--CoA ligase [Mycobacterium heckeshornense]PIJ37050.1 long-chain fatty acid--CoA ligase [Mycobacterium heckeshornense]BCO35137.1 AMP-binding protein [Mycobacterium heckeshornense]
MPDTTVDQVVRSRAAQHPDKPMVIDPSSRMTYSELDSSTRALAAAFVEAGVGKGTRVGLVMPNGVRWVQVAIALTRIGAVLVPLSTLLQPRELLAQLQTASVQLLITVEEFRGHRYLDDLRSALGSRELGTEELLHHPKLPALRRIWTVDLLTKATASSAAIRIIDSLTRTVTASDPFVIVFTSGSSGPPKGVLHSHGSALGAVQSGLASRCIDAETRLYLPMPFFWVGGLGGGVLSALLAGATLVTEAIPRPESTLRLLERERVTLFRGWPDQAEALARKLDAVEIDLSALQPGSLDALLAPDRRAAPGARANLFGMTESFGPYCGYPADTDMPRSAWGSCGKPFPGMEVRIADSDTGRALPVGTVGMIQIRGPHILRGICRRSREDVFTPHGFYSTGDLGHFDPEGFLFYHGRADDMFKVSGASVYPSEVEQALRSIDGVDKAVVTNVCGAQGNRVGAAVVCNTATVTVDELREAARRLLSAFKVPTVWLLVDSDDDIPRGPTGKVDIPRVREMLANLGSAEWR